MPTPHVRVLQNLKRQTDAQLIASADAVKGPNGNPAYANPPVDLKAAQAAVDSLNAAIAAQPSGGPPATAHKNNKREELIAILRRLAHARPIVRRIAVRREPTRRLSSPTIIPCRACSDSSGSTLKT